MFPGEFCQICNNNIFLEHLQTAASETVTENSLENSVWVKNFQSGWKLLIWDEKLHLISISSTLLNKLESSARAENLHIVSPVDVSLGSKYTSAQRLQAVSDSVKIFGSDSIYGIENSARENIINLYSPHGQKKKKDIKAALCKQYNDSMYLNYGYSLNF